MTQHSVLIDGAWREATSKSSFQAANPATGAPLPDQYPVSEWADCERALEASARAAEALLAVPASQIAAFLESCAQKFAERRKELVEMAHAETGLPVTPRLADVELPRTVDQLRQAAAAARDGSWALPTIDAQCDIRSHYAALGPVCVFGPNNFPFAFGSISGGDFAAAIAAGNPVIAKANSSHPGTTRLFAEAAFDAQRECDLPPAAVQLLYRLGHEDGERLVADPRIGATAYTGSRNAGLRLKAAADAAGRPIYLELSSVNPVIMLPGAIAERAAAIADEFSQSCLLGTGQFCTNPGLMLLVQDDQTESFVEQLSRRFAAAPIGTLLSAGVAGSLRSAIDVLRAAGADLIAGEPGEVTGPCRCANTLLRTTGDQFLADAHAMQTEAFGNAALIVVCHDVEQLCQVARNLDGNLTGCIYSHTDGSDDATYNRVAPLLRRRVGRLLNDKMPTGVAVSPAMNHGGPYPATGHPGFTAVGIPASLRRFAALHCYDNVRAHRLPTALR